MVARSRAYAVVGFCPVCAWKGAMKMPNRMRVITYPSRSGWRGLEDGHAEVAIPLPLGRRRGRAHRDADARALELLGYIRHALVDCPEWEVGMEVERELEVVRAPGHVGDLGSDEA